MKSTYRWANTLHLYLCSYCNRVRGHGHVGLCTVEVAENTLRAKIAKAGNPTLLIPSGAIGITYSDGSMYECIECVRKELEAEGPDSERPSWQTNLTTDIVSKQVTFVMPNTGCDELCDVCETPLEEHDP